MRAAQILFTLALLAVLWRATDGREAMRTLAAADPVWLLAAFAALSFQTVLSALRWRLAAGQLGIFMGRASAIGEYYLSQIVNQSLPGGMVGDAGRAVRSRGAAGLVRAGQAVVFERLAGQVALFAVMAVAIAVTWVRPGGLDWPRWLVPTVGLILLAGVAAPCVLAGLVWLPGAMGRGMRGMWGAMSQALLAREVLARHILLSLGTAACNLAAFAFCARSIGVDLPLSAVLALVPLILFTMLIPISVSGWGLREGAAAALFPVIGATATQGFATSVAFGLVFLATVLPGVVPLWLRPKARPAEHDAQTGKARDGAASHLARRGAHPILKGNEEHD